MYELKICALTATINKLVTYIGQLNGQHTDESHKTMKSALMGYLDEWWSDKKVSCTGKLIHSPKQTQAFTSQLETC